MIYNERQLKISTSQREKIAHAIESLRNNDDSSWVIDAQISALSSQLKSIESEISVYQLLKQGKLKYSKNADLSSLPSTLIQARIAMGFSQKDLANRLNLKPQQVQRYEASNYMGASLSRLIEISHTLGVQLQGVWNSPSTDGNSFFTWENEENIKWNKFPIKEMIKRNWLKIEKDISPVHAIRNFFNRAAGSQYATALHRKKFHGSNTPNEYALLAWQARVLEKARAITATGNVPEFELNDSWLEELIQLSTSNDSPRKVQQYLLQKGILLVTEPHLSGTYLDGAAMLLETGNPVIALTLRHDRLDNFWFVLMHELGHVFLHLYESLNIDFFDEEDDAEEDELEKEADSFAQNALIPEEQWELCLSRFSMSESSVKLDADNLGIHPSIIAGRIRLENKGFHLLNSMVGQGEVRQYFEEY